MRRVAAILLGTLLVATLASGTLAAGPAGRFNRFIGNFQMLDPETGASVGRVVVAFTEPSTDRLVPGDLVVHWAPDVTATTFPFLDLEWGPVKESHAQLIGASFGVEPGYAIVAGTDGYLCDYTTPWNGDCRPFGVHFDRVSGDGPNQVYWAVGGAPEVRFDVGPGTFSLTYVGPTG